jgi:hypothetical protein
MTTAPSYWFRYETTPSHLLFTVKLLSAIGSDTKPRRKKRGVARKELLKVRIMVNVQG